MKLSDTEYLRVYLFCVFIYFAVLHFKLRVVRAFKSILEETDRKSQTSAHIRDGETIQMRRLNIKVGWEDENTSNDSAKSKNHADRQ